MTKTRRQYNEEFKRETAQLMKTSGKPVAQITRELGINDNVLYRWRRQFRQATSSHGRSVAELETALKQLRRENRRLKLENEILKKAAAYFAKESM